RSWRETLLVCWILVPAAFFQLWPVKGFQYLLPIAPAFAVLAGRTLALWPGRRYLRIRRLRLPLNWVSPLLTLGVVAELLFASWSSIQGLTATDQFVAGSGGVPGGREMGEWIEAHVPAGAQFLAIGPSMANIIQFYGHRKAYGLAVSPNPLHRNPS